MNRCHVLLLACAVLSWSKMPSLGQHTTTTPDRLPEINPLSGEILIWRPQSKKPEKLTQASKVTPQDRIGTPGGNLGRIAIDAGCVVTLKGVTATEEDGLSV